jgi:hypothetical protein
LRKEIYMAKAFACIVFAMAVAIPLAACGGEKPPMKTGIAPPTRIPEVPAPAGPAGEPVSAANVPLEVRRAVVGDAAQRFKVAQSAVVLTQAEKVTWSDAALGCPQPGMGYTQMLVSGFRIVARTSAGSLTYNTDGSGRFVICGTVQRPGVKKAVPPMMDTEPRPYPPPSAPEK